MSHFTVCVRVSNDMVLAAGSVEGAVKVALAPYQENNMGDCPEQFLKFVDEEDEHLKDYETGSCEMVRCEDGSLAYKWDGRFKVPGQFGIGTGTHKVPAHLKLETVPHKVRFATFEDFVAGWVGHDERDAKTGRFGRWENPNAKWDWYQIGGRWSGFFPVKSVAAAARLGKRSWASGPQKVGHADMARISDIDFDKVAQLSTERSEKFWGEWQRFLAGEKFNAFDGPRSTALRIGLLDVKKEALTADEQTRAIPWSSFVRSDDERRSWHDVYKVISKEEFLRDYLLAFSPVSTFAVLDETGWHEAGEMGWFGMSSDTPESHLAHARAFPEWLRATPADSWLVAVDCHI